MALFVFHLMLMPLEKAWIHQLAFLQIWGNSWTDWVLWSFWDNQSRRKTLNLNQLWIVEQTLSLDKATNLGEGKLSSQTTCTLLWQSRWVNIHLMESINNLLFEYGQVFWFWAFIIRLHNLRRSLLLTIWM